MPLYHGTKHPYAPGAVLVPGGIVAPCSQRLDGEPTPGCDCGCDSRRMVWATPVLADAIHASEHRACTCGTATDGHRPRVFEVMLEDPQPDPNAYATASVMSTTGRVVAEVLFP